MAEAAKAVVSDEDFDKEFAAAAEAAQAGAAAKPVADVKTPDQIAAEAKVAEEAKAAADAAKVAAETKTPEQVAAEAKAAEDAAKAAADAARAAESPEDKATREAAEAQAAKDVKVAEEAKAAEEARIAAAVKAVVKTQEQVAAEEKTAAEVKAKAEADAKVAAEKAVEALKDYEPTVEEAKALETFAKDFPTEKVAIEARLKALDRVVDQRVSKAVKEVLQIVYKDFAPIAQGYSTDAQEKHVRAVHEAVPDFDAIVDKVPVWIKTQPTYLQPAMQAAYEKGSTADVIDLMKAYKAAVAPAAAQAPAGDVQKPKPAGADDLAPVGTKRSTPAPKGGADPNDFEGAFAEAAAAMK